MSDSAILAPQEAPKKRAGMVKALTFEEILNQLARMPDPNHILTKANIVRKDLLKIAEYPFVLDPMETRLGTIMGQSWRIMPPDGMDEETTNQIWACVERHWAKLIESAWCAIPFGYSTTELIYEPDPEMPAGLSLVEVDNKPFHWFAFTVTGEIRFYPAGSTEGEEVDTEWKVLLTRRKASRAQPYGRALLASLYWPWFFSHHGLRMWAQALERWGTGILVGSTSPGNVMNAEGQLVDALDDLADRLEDATQSGVVVLNKERDELDNLSSQVGGISQPHKTMLDHLKSEARVIFLGQNLTSEVKEGSLAAAQVHNDVRKERTEEDKTVLLPTIKRFVEIVSYLYAPNLPPAGFEWLETKGLQVDRATRDKALYDQGVRFTPVYYLRNYEFEEDEIEAELAQPQQQQFAGPTPSGFSAHKCAHLAHFAAGDPILSPQQEEVETLVETALANVKNPINPKHIMAAIAQAETASDVPRLLAALVDPEETSQKDYRKALQIAMFSGDVLGYGHAAVEAGVTDES